MKEKKCIICREIKKEYNREHVFPETIGGSFVINLVCEECNKQMGDDIDTPFVNHKLILLFRHQFNLNRGNRNAKIPFKGEYETEEGKKFVVSKKDGQFIADYKRDFAIEGSPDEPVGHLTLSAKFMGSEQELVEQYSKLFEKKTGKKVGHYVITREPGSPVTVNEIESDNKFIFGCLKIGYETAVAFIPSYYDDELAVAYSKMLSSAEFDRSLKQYMNPPHSLTKEVAGILNNYPTVAGYTCLAALLTIPGQGLVAGVKVFSMFYCFILSTTEDYIDKKILLLLTDSIRRTHDCISIDRTVG